MSLSSVLALVFSIMGAWALMVVHLPFQWQWLRPEWLSLVLIYWVLTRPKWVGIGIAWTSGLVMDILGGSLIGQYAMAMSIIVFFAQLLQHRVRLFPFWQQSFVVLVLVGLGQLSVLTIQWLIGNPPRTWMFWSSTLTSIALWPIFYHYLRSTMMRATSFH